MARTCIKCGTALAGTEKFCATCGAPVPASSSTLESKAFTPPKVKTPFVDEPPPTRASSPGGYQPPAPQSAPQQQPPSSAYGPPPPPANPAPPQAYAPYAPAPQPAYAPAPQPAYAPNPQPAAYPAQPGYPPAQGYAPAPPPAGYVQYAPPAPGYAPPFVAGARVLVQWADGNRYPGIVHQVAPAHCLVVFPDGQQRWVELQYLALAR